MSESLHVFELEQLLAEDSQGIVLQQTLKSLDEQLAYVKHRIGEGLAQDDFRAAHEYIKALEAASRVVEKVWKREHSAAV